MAHFIEQMGYVSQTGSIPLLRTFLKRGRISSGGSLGLSA